MGSALTEAAASSRKHSCAKVFCRRDGDRNGPVKKGERMVCVRTRSLLTVPAPAQLVPMQPATYEGAALLPLRSVPLGGVVARGDTPAGSNPTSEPVMTLPGASYPGRPPSDGSQAS